MVNRVGLCIILAAITAVISLAIMATTNLVSLSMVFFLASVFLIGLSAYFYELECEERERSFENKISILRNLL